nr:uncharacterized protein LOC124816124 [Hydra vulgaris]XP_047141126.1 uncharacterized protein LOC124816124 [Hydra vulgaris]XP_047141131.1 uncharacterized protein LOC124816124 [Hydra vulgaris]
MNNQTRTLQERIKNNFIDNGIDQAKMKIKTKLRVTRSYPFNADYQLVSYPESLSLIKKSEVNIATNFFRKNDGDGASLQPVGDTYQEVKKVKLGPTRSCPYYKKNSPMCFNRNTSLTELILPSKIDSNIYYCNFETDDRSMVVTKQPTNYTSINYKTEYYSKQSSLTSCLYYAKNVVSCCTCFWCLEALCYHCVSKDDIGSNHIVKNALTIKGSKLNHAKRLAICFSCLPFFPCLGLYPILNGLLDYCIDKSNNKSFYQ